MKQLAFATMNVGQAGITKIQQIHDKIRDFDVICLQEININLASIVGFVQAFRKLGYHVLLGSASDAGFVRVAIISKLPLRKIFLEGLSWSDRIGLFPRGPAGTRP